MLYRLLLCSFMLTSCAHFSKPELKSEIDNAIAIQVTSEGQVYRSQPVRSKYVNASVNNYDEKQKKLCFVAESEYAFKESQHRLLIVSAEGLEDTKKEVYSPNEIVRVGEHTRAIMGTETRRSTVRSTQPGGRDYVIETPERAVVGHSTVAEYETCFVLNSPLKSYKGRYLAFEHKNKEFYGLVDHTGYEVWYLRP